MNDNKGKQFLDDIAKLFGDALGAIGSLKNETETFAQEKIENYFSKMNFVRREEFEVLQNMLSKILSEQQEMIKQIEKLEQEKRS